MHGTPVRVMLPSPLRALAGIASEIAVPVPGTVSVSAILDVLEDRYPMLRGTMRDHVTRQRRAFVRFYACAQDLSHASPEDPLPERIANGQEPLLIVGAMAGG